MGQIEGLLAWNQVKEILDGRHTPPERPSLLVGNGASIAVSQSFRYEKLREHAELDEIATQLFEEVGTSDFELVLNRLGTSLMVNDVFGIESDDIRDAYAQIKSALIAAVHTVHIRGNEYYPNNALDEEFTSYARIYSTNYDMLLYWAMLQLNSHRNENVVDLFRGRHFDRDHQFENHSTRLMYLHGALHLFENREKICFKRTGNGLSILDQLDDNGIARVHFVSEGNWIQKMAKIRSSDYLSYCYEQLEEDHRDIVIFGHSLNADSDQHILNALLKHPERIFAVSLHTDGRRAVEINDSMNEFRTKLSGLEANQIIFYDSSTHPLGAPGQNTPFGLLPALDDQ
tara:strand:+ start:5983 stop:7014 length:1032 start_codon:yes stop_codon:yes gene_type:complete